MRAAAQGWAAVRLPLDCLVLHSPFGFADSSACVYTHVPTNQFRMVCSVGGEGRGEGSGLVKVIADDLA